MRCPATSWLQRTKSRTENTQMPPRLNAVEIDTPPVRPAATLPQGSAAARDWRSCFRPVRAQDRSLGSETLRSSWASRSNRGAGDFVAEVGQLSGSPALAVLHRPARPRPSLGRKVPDSDGKRGIHSSERLRSRLKQTFAEKIPSVMRKGFGRHIEPDRLEPKALHP
jgi:hypothetical protein